MELAIPNSEKVEYAALTGAEYTLIARHHGPAPGRAESLAFFALGEPAPVPLLAVPQVALTTGHAGEDRPGPVPFPDKACRPAPAAARSASCPPLAAR